MSSVSLYAWSNPFQLATKKGEPLDTNLLGYNMVDKVDNCMPLELPNLTVAFKEKLSSEEVEALKTLGAGVIPNKAEDQVKYTFGAKDVNKELLTLLYKHKKKANHKCSTPTGSVNLAVVQSYIKVNAIFTWFLKTQSYPAFSGPIDNVEEGGSYAFDTIEGFITTKRKAVQVDRREKRVRMNEEVEEEEEDVEMDEDSATFMAIDEMLFGDAVSKIPRAKPSTPPVSIFGPASNVPALPGLSFPFFDGILEPDTAYVSNVIKQFFLESLGDGRAEILQGWNDLKLHMGLLAETKQGRVLQHISIGVSLAVQCQARAYPIFEGKRYVGFTLHGFYFQVVVDGYKHSPKSAVELVKEVQSIDEHNVALAKVLQLLSKIKMTDTNKVPTKKSLQDERPALKNPRRLAALIRKFRLDDDQRDEIEKLCNALTFPQRYWVIEEKRILEAVDMLIAGTFPSDDVPLYPRGGCLTTQDPKLSVFAAFGETSFSLRLTGGTPHKVPKDIASDTLFKPYRGKNDKEVTPKPNVILAKKGLNLCLEDWALFFGDHVVYTKQSRDAIFRSVVFGGERAKTLWYGLINRIGVLTIADTKKTNAEGIDIGEDAELLNDENEDSFADFL